ncbi:MAG: hypothetical protein M1830_005109 [Pleopsidium flavum]|nr:MAG: hypothetical protein M1830_005109 [Pleopsidium flavum]
MRITPSNSVRAEGATCINGAVQSREEQSASFIPALTATAGHAPSRLGLRTQAVSSIAMVSLDLPLFPRPSQRIDTILSLPVPTGGSCANDGNEEIGAGGSQKRNVGNATMGATPRYRTGSGSEVLIPGGAFIGQTALRVIPINQALWAKQAGSHNFSSIEVDGYDTQYNYMHDNLVIEKDTIVERIG